MGPSHSPIRRAAALFAVLLVVLGAAVALDLGLRAGTRAQLHPGHRAPLAEAGHLVRPIAICGSRRYLHSPYSYTGVAGPYPSGRPGLPTYGSPGSSFPADKGAVVVRPGRLSLSELTAARTLYYFEPGRYPVSAGGTPGLDDTYVGGYAGGGYAIWDGERSTQVALNGGGVPGVTVEYLTVQDFMPTASTNVVNNAGSGTYWTVEHTTMRDNGNVAESGDGSALQMAAHDTYEYNCLTDNGDYAINAAAAGGYEGTFVDAVVDYNEISYNGIAYYPNDHGCGCSGGIKFWQSVNAKFVGNYVHNNYNPGAWFDTNNTGMYVADNYIADNYAMGISVEISYNGDITGNTLVGNGIGNHSAGILVNQSGGSAIAGSDYENELLVTDNTLVDNWDGIIVFNDSGRYCGSGGDSVCTLAPSYWPQTDFTACRAVYGLSLSETPKLGRAPFSRLCSWTAQEVHVSGNVISFNPKTVRVTASAPCDPGTDASAGDNGCGLDGEWAFVSGGGWRSSISSRQAPLDVATLDGGVLALRSTDGIWQQAGEVQMATSHGSGSAIVSYAGVRGDDLTGVRLVSGSGHIVPGTAVAFVNSGCSSSGSAPFTCLDLAAVQTQFKAGNTWERDDYYGPQYFDVFSGAVVDWATWSGPRRPCLAMSVDSCPGPFGEDRGGSYQVSGGPYWDFPPAKAPVSTKGA